MAKAEHNDRLASKSFYSTFHCHRRAVAIPNGLGACAHNRGVTQNVAMYPNLTHMRLPNAKESFVCGAEI